MRDAFIILVIKGIFLSFKTWDFCRTAWFVIFCSVGYSLMWCAAYAIYSKRFWL